MIGTSVKFIKCGICVAATLVVAPASAATADDFQVWSSLNLNANLSRDVVAALEISGRTANDSSRLADTLVRPTIGYRVSDALTVHIGYLHQRTIRVGLSNIDENRFFQQTSWRIGKIGNATVSSRTRIELRTVERARDSGWRVRQLLRFQLPLAAKNSNFVVSSEQMFALNSTDWGARAGFDQMRNFIGVSFPLSKAFQFETGFQHRYQRRVGQPDRSDFVLPLTVNVRL